MRPIEPIRKALLIGSPGEGENYLHGVSADVQNFSEYLYSERGGLWNENEIEILWQPGIKEIEATLEKNTADYLVTYYSGHGFTSTEGNRMVNLQDSFVNDLYLVNDSPRQLCIFDCCRDKEPPVISGIPDQRQPFEGLFTAREILDQYILASDPGIKIIHGTGNGFPAYDESSRHGGILILNFLKAAENIYKQNNYSPITIEEIIELTAQYLKTANSYQIPEIVYEEGNLQVPFALSSAKELSFNISKAKNYQSVKRLAKPVAKKHNDWIVPGLILAAVLLYDNN